MTAEDIEATFENQQLLVDGEILMDFDKVKEYLHKFNSKGYPKIKPNLLEWVPFLFRAIRKEEERFFGNLI